MDAWRHNCLAWGKPTTCVEDRLGLEQPSQLQICQAPDYPDPWRIRMPFGYVWPAEDTNHPATSCGQSNMAVLGNVSILTLSRSKASPKTATCKPAMEAR